MEGGILEITTSGSTLQGEQPEDLRECFSEIKGSISGCLSRKGDGNRSPLFLRKMVGGREIVFWTGSHILFKIHIDTN